MKREFGSLTVIQLPVLQDNYAFLLRENRSGICAVVDTPDAVAITAALEELKWGLDLILNTHWHHDHTGGNLALKERYGARILGPENEGDRIPGRDQALVGGDRFQLGELGVNVMATPGHTQGHICFIIEELGVGFVGDTLFSLGCGRLFEGTPAQMWQSLCALKALPEDMTLYCAHEYTAANARFAESLGEENVALAARIEEITQLRAALKPTVPMNLSKELQTNPFLRADNETMKKAVGMEGASAVEAFAHIRQLKDNFRG